MLLLYMQRESAEFQAKVGCEMVALWLTSLNRTHARTHTPHTHTHTQQRKTDETKEKQEMNSLFRPVQTQKVSAGADPKSVLCLFFTQGQCTKGDKCKFSHDLSLAGKTEKRSLYVDSRDLEEGTLSDDDHVTIV